MPAPIPRRMPNARKKEACSQWSASVPRMYPAATEAGSVRASERYFPSQKSDLSCFPAIKTNGNRLKT